MSLLRDATARGPRLDAVSRLLRTLSLGLVVVLSALWAGCSSVTQLLVVVRSDLPAERIASVDVEVVGYPSSAPPLERTLRIAGDGDAVLPFSFGVVPPGGNVGARVQITVTARAEDGSVTVTRVVRTGFRQGFTLAVPVFLAAACAPVSCSGDTTCAEGVCGSPDVPVDDLEPVRPGDELAPVDASTPDAGNLEGPDGATDAGSSDAGTEPVVGFPRPTLASSRELGGNVIVREILPGPGGEVVVVLDVPPDTILFGASQPVSPTSSTVVARLDASLDPVWTFPILGSITSGGASWTGDHIVVCGSYMGSITPGDLPEMGAPADIAGYVVDLDGSGNGRGLAVLSAGNEIVCGDVVATSSDVVHVAWELGDMALSSSPLVTLSGCPNPRAAVVRFTLGSGAPGPSNGVGFGTVQRGGIRLASDGMGGSLVGLASMGSGDENLGSSCGAGGPLNSLELVRLEASAARRWSRRIAEVPEAADAAVFLDVAATGDRAVMLASLDAASFRVLDGDGVEVSSMSTTPRLLLASRLLGDGNDPVLRLDNGSLGSLDLVGREPDVALCSQTPRLTRPGFVSGIFGVTVPTGGPYGLVAGLRPADSLPNQWLVTAASADSTVTACAPDDSGGLWVAPLFADSGTFFGQSIFGGGLVHMEP
jgi:hypothetical protein